MLADIFQSTQIGSLFWPIFIYHNLILSEQGRFPSEDLNTRLWAIYDSRYSHQDYDSVLGGVHELSYSNININ